MAGRASLGRYGLRGHAGRSAALARLLHEDCVQLLELYVSLCMNTFVPRHNLNIGLGVGS